MYVYSIMYIYMQVDHGGGDHIHIYIFPVPIPSEFETATWGLPCFRVEFQGSTGSFWINIGLHRPENELTGNQKCMKLLVQMSFSSKNIAPDINSPERFGVFEASIKQFSRHILDQLIRLGFFSGIKLGHTVSRQFDPRILWNKYPLIVSKNYLAIVFLRLPRKSLVFKTIHEKIVWCILKLIWDLWQTVDKLW